jgi:hypothetical protein
MSRRKGTVGSAPRPIPLATARVLGGMSPYRASGEQIPGFEGRREAWEARYTGLRGKNTGPQGKSAAARRDHWGSPASLATTRPFASLAEVIELKVNLTFRGSRLIFSMCFRSPRPTVWHLPQLLRTEKCCTQTPACCEVAFFFAQLAPKFQLAIDDWRYALRPF